MLQLKLNIVWLHSKFAFVLQGELDISEKNFQNMINKKCDALSYQFLAWDTVRQFNIPRIIFRDSTHEEEGEPLALPRESTWKRECGLLWRLLVRSAPRLAKTRPPCAPLENVIIGFKCQMARAAITQGSETMYEAGRVRGKSLLNNELTSRLTREFFVRGDFGDVEGVATRNHLHEAVASDF